jgi:hypothetical protein
MGRKSSEGSFEIQPGLYLKSQGGLLHCYFRIDGRAFRRSTRTDNVGEATERAKAWYRNAQLRASLGASFETVSFQKLAAAYGKHIEGLSKARYQLPTLKRHFLPYFANVRDISQLRTPEILAYFDHLLSDNHHGRYRQPAWPVGLDGRRACPSGGQPHRPD